MEETRVPGENPRPAQVTGKLYHILLYRVHPSGFERTTFVVICTDCICSYKSNYHTITTTTTLTKYYIRTIKINIKLWWFNRISFSYFFEPFKEELNRWLPFPVWPSPSARTMRWHQIVILVRNRWSPLGTTSTT